MNDSDNDDNDDDNDDAYVPGFNEDVSIIFTEQTLAD
jgi:hypothetical protein